MNFNGSSRSHWKENLTLVYNTKDLEVTVVIWGYINEMELNRKMDLS